MSDETRAKLRELYDEETGYDRGSGWTPMRDFDAALTAHEQAVAAEAVLAFAGWVNDHHPYSVVDAHDFIQAQGWSETPAQAERGIKALALLSGAIEDEPRIADALMTALIDLEGGPLRLHPVLDAQLAITTLRQEL